jgi:putative radical SAM enzyme (TIGR03279 family)
VSVHATDPVVRRWLLRNPEAPDVVPQLRWFAERGISFHTQVVLVPGINDGPQLVRTLSDLYGVGAAVLSVSVVPVALTEFSKHALVRQPTREECRAALATVDDFAARAVADRGMPWCYGADDLYLLAGVPLPPAEWYGDFEQRENGVGAVRYLQTRIAAARPALADAWRDKRIGIVTGTAMGPLIPQIVTDLTQITQAHFEILALENTLFGPSVTTAGLLPGKAVLAALRDRRDLDLALLPAESVNDDLLFMDDMEAHDLAGQLPMPVRLSYDFADALEDGMMERRNDGMSDHSNIPSFQRSTEGPR